MENKTKGKKAEESAIKYLQNRGFEILESNYRSGRSEIDIIGLLNNELLVFFEVKFRKNDRFGHPEEFVSENQQKAIIRAADQYIHDINWEKDIRFDILALSPNADIEHFEDAFY